MLTAKRVSRVPHKQVEHPTPLPPALGAPTSHEYMIQPHFYNHVTTTAPKCRHDHIHRTEQSYPLSNLIYPVAAGYGTGDCSNNSY